MSQTTSYAQRSQSGNPLKRIVRNSIPRPLWLRMALLKKHLISGDWGNGQQWANVAKGQRFTHDGKQDLDLYWDPEMAKILDTWGEGNAWNEVQMLFMNANGKVLDIACGTGKTMEILRKFSNIELYGCDISDFLLSKAEARGFKKDHLLVTDATNMSYSDDQFSYSYSIGSLEHFTIEGIDKFIAEAKRVTKCGSYHMIPVSRSNTNEGWMKTLQSFHNNSVDWWLDKFRAHYPTVYALDSKWDDEISLGKWIICNK